MLINANLLVNNPEIVQGLISGSMVRYGSVIRYAAGTQNAGQIIKHLSKAPGIGSRPLA
jgi:hypothetical protein